MKKMFLILNLILATTFQAQARETLLEETVLRFDELYGQAGIDNNGIEMIHFSTQSIDQVIKEIKQFDPNLVIVKQLDLTEAFKSVKKCLFMKEGAYGDHLSSNSERNKLSKMFLTELNDNYILTPEIYLLENIRFDLFNNNCALLLRSTLGHEIGVISGYAID